MSKNVYLASKPRYEILDGLRGVAAILVVAFHLFETYSAGPDYQIINHGYLAVDFFFMLSGFVIGYAYDDRWGAMSTWSCGNGIYNAAIILLVFPLIVSMGAGSKVTGKRSTAVCNWLGEISYPLYITHYPLVYMQMAWANTHADAPASTHVMVGIGVFVLALAMAWGAYKLYDLPMREWLKDKLFSKK